MLEYPRWSNTTSPRSPSLPEHNANITTIPRAAMGNKDQKRSSTTKGIMKLDRPPWWSRGPGFDLRSGPDPMYCTKTQHSQGKVK